MSSLYCSGSRSNSWRRPTQAEEQTPNELIIRSEFSLKAVHVSSLLQQTVQATEWNLPS